MLVVFAKCVVRSSKRLRSRDIGILNSEKIKTTNASFDSVVSHAVHLVNELSLWGDAYTGI